MEHYKLQFVVWVKDQSCAASFAFVMKLATATMHTATLAILMCVFDMQQIVAVAGELAGIRILRKSEVVGVRLLLLAFSCAKRVLHGRS